MERTIFTNGLVFDGSGTPPAPGEVTVEADRVVSVTPGWSAGTGPASTAPDGSST